MEEKGLITGVIRAPKTKTIEKIDKKDKKIIRELVKNSRTTLSTIAKRVSLSQEVVNYRINKLVKRGIIVNFYSVININKFGFNRFRVLFQLNPIEDQRKQEFSEYLLQHNSVFWVLEIKGKYDFLVGIAAKNYQEFDDIFSDMTAKFHDLINDTDISITIEQQQTSMKYIIEDKEDFAIKRIKQKKDVSFASEFSKYKPQKQEKLSIDKTDIEILKMLNKDSRKTLTSIGKQFNLSRDVVKYRIRKMINDGIIKDFQIRINHFKLGFNCSTLLLKLKTVDEDRKNEVFKFIKSQNLVNIVVKQVSEWNWSVEVYYRNTAEFSRIMNTLKSFLGDDLINYEHLMQYDQLNYTFLTKSIIDSLLNKNEKHK